MSAEVELAVLAAALACPSRAIILDALMGGVSLPASELAYRAGITNPTASAHLARLRAAGLVRMTRDGRHRHYEIAHEEVARTIEVLASLTPKPESGPAGRHRGLERLRQARFCYDHLAGRLGVALTDALVAAGMLVPEGCDFILSPTGEARLAALGVDVGREKATRRHFARSCQDWSERRPHLAGALGAAVARRFVELGWIERSWDDRSVQVTAAGTEGLQRIFGLTWGGPAGPPAA